MSHQVGRLRTTWDTRCRWRTSRNALEPRQTASSKPSASQPSTLNSGGCTCRFAVDSLGAGCPDLLSDTALDAFRHAEDNGGVGVSIVSFRSCRFDLWYATHKRGSSRVARADYEFVKSTLLDPDLNFHIVELSRRAVPHIEFSTKKELSDPWDRLIVTTALEHNLPLVTSDKKISDLAVIETIW